MKTNRNVLKAVAAAVLASVSGLAAAAGTTTVDVNATVPNVCTFSAASMAAINLGALNPSTVPAIGVSGTRNITYNCTNGLTPNVTIQSGGTTLTDGTKTIGYSFTLGAPEAGLGYAVAGSSKVVGTATVTQAAVQGAEEGTYSDTVTLEIDN
jgi:spore coat protein U-like protein